MIALLLVLIVVLSLLTQVREPFLGFLPDAVIVGGKSWWTTDPKVEDGVEIYNTTPNTCPPDRPELDAGLCYPRCRSGYNGVGPVCWADSKDVGVGKPVGLEPCPLGWNNDGLTCREPIRCASGWDFFKYGCSGGKVRGRLNGGGICDWPRDRGNLPNWLKEERKNAVVYKGTFDPIPADKIDSTPPENKERKNILLATHPDKVDGLCYKTCPKDMPTRIAGMPYLCYKGGELSYGRGAGTVPPIVRIGRRFSPF